MDKQIKNIPVKKHKPTNVAKFILHTRYGYEHLGLRETKKESDKRVPFPGLMLLSIRISQLSKIKHGKDDLLCKKTQELLDCLEKNIELEFNAFKIEEKAVDNLIKSDMNILHDNNDERWTKTYEIPCNSQLVWKAIRLLILYDTVVRKYLNLWNTAGIKKEPCFTKISQFSATIRRLIEKFNIDSKKVIYQKPE